MNLTESQTVAIVRKIDPEFRWYVAQYDERKYPPAELHRLRDAFARPASVSGSNIKAALVWKYGHTGKDNYPKRHLELGMRIAKLWPDNAIQPGHDPECAFQQWWELLGPSSFITVCFLLHLANPDDIPILDQHNFRSVNYHLMTGSRTRLSKAKPIRFEDLVLVRDFSKVVLRDWGKAGVGATPSASDMDRYLMMHGKEMKKR